MAIPILFPVLICKRVYDAVYYYNRPTDAAAMQGFGAVLMAGAEVTQMLRSFDVQKRLNTFHYFQKKS